MSPAIQFLAVLWDEIPGGSWRRINTSMHRALHLAIEAGLEFELGDFEIMAARFRLGYWIGDRGDDRAYAIAAAHRNLSACRCLEDHLGMRPWILYGQRLGVGFGLQWEGEPHGHITSMGGDELIVTVPRGWDEAVSGFDNTPRRVIRVGRSEFKAAIRAAKGAGRKIGWRKPR